MCVAVGAFRPPQSASPGCLQSPAPHIGLQGSSGTTRPHELLSPAFADAVPPNLEVSLHGRTTPSQPCGVVARAPAGPPADVGPRLDSAAHKLGDLEESLPVSESRGCEPQTETNLANVCRKGQTQEGLRIERKVKDRTDRIRLLGCDGTGWGSSHQEPTRGSPWHTTSAPPASLGANQPHFRCF